MYKGYNPGLRNYRRERSRATLPISDRLGDCFHDGERALGTVSIWHDRASQTLWRTDHITPGILKIVADHMLQEDSDERLEAIKLWKKWEKLVHGGTNGNTSNDVGIASGMGSMLLDSSPPLMHPPREPPPQHPTPSVQWHHPQSSRGNDRYSSQSDPSSQPSRILSGPRANSPDRFSGYGGDDPGSSSAKRYSAPDHHSRPASQPQSSISRPVVQPYSFSDNHLMVQHEGMILEENPFDEESSRQATLSGNPNLKGKAPDRREPPSHGNSMVSTTRYDGMARTNLMNDRAPYDARYDFLNPQVFMGI
jgi:hypothetical protein